MPWNPIWSTTKVLAHHVRNSYAAVALERNSPVSSGCCSHENADFSVLSNDSLPGQDYGHYDRWSKNYVRKFLSTVFKYIIIMKLSLSSLKHTLSRLSYWLYVSFSKNTIIIYPIQHLLKILQNEIWKCFARQKSKILLWRWQKIYIKSCYVSIPQNFF